MNCVVSLPGKFVGQLKSEKETGIGYQVVAVELKDGRSFEQVATSEGCIIEVRGFKGIPFSADEIVSVRVNHKTWNFREASDSRARARAATA